MPVPREQDRRLALSRLLMNTGNPSEHMEMLSGAILANESDAKVRVLSIDSEPVFCQQQDEILITPKFWYTDVHIGKRLDTSLAEGF
jgi:hypothetical protein